MNSNTVGDGCYANGDSNCSRVVSVCTRDLGQGQAAQFDIETWMPSRASDAETHSASRFSEVQADDVPWLWRSV